MSVWTRGLHPLIEQTAVADALALATGRRPSALRQLPAKPPRAVFEALLEGAPPLIFKAEVTLPDHDHEIALEGWTLQQAHAAGLTVPRVIAADSSNARFPFRYLVMTRLDGSAFEETALDDATRPRVLAEAARQIARLHAIEVPGYGPLDEDAFLRDGVVRGRWPRWRDATAGAGIETLEMLARAGLIGDEQRSDLRQVLERQDIPDQPPASLLHGDFDASQVYVAAERFSGIIDFGDREAGPPEWEFATVWLWDKPLLEELLGPYEQATGRRLDRALIRVYALAKLLQILRRRLNRRDIQDAARKSSDLQRFLSP